MQHTNRWGNTRGGGPEAPTVLVGSMVEVYQQDGGEIVDPLNCSTTPGVMDPFEASDDLSCPLPIGS